MHANGVCIRMPAGGIVQGVIRLPKITILVCNFLIFFGLAIVAQAKMDVRESMVKIYSVRNQPYYDNPWNIRGPKASSGSGCVIEGNRILTNAHVVSDQTFIQVRLHGKSKKHPAQVLAVSHEADLALLTVENPAFFHGIKPLLLGKLPEVQQDVVVYGFPRGGDTLSTTKGVISRIEHQRYSHSSMDLLAAQLDAAVNPGNSGGPVMMGDRVVGVVMQSLRNSENIGYMVPIPVVRHFLADVDDGRYDGFPVIGIYCQSMENSALRKMYGLGEKQSGALVVSVLPGTPAEGKICPSDVILSLDGSNVADDRTVEFRHGERTSMNYCIQRHQIGEEMSLRILREGKEQTIRITLDKAWGYNNLIPKLRYDVLPTYYIYGGLVFCPLTMNYLFTMNPKNAPPNLLYFLYNNKPTVKGEEAVIIVKILPSEVNNGYQEFVNERITEVNGKKIKNLWDLIRIVESGTEGRFVVFKNPLGNKIVLDRRMVEKEQDKILRTYRVPSDRSDDLR
ncbi:MAG: trypsin-like peptidase domain-containing protein [Deltaproteobacteria bacterium]|nr:trypsin-like peptidase domain-containing protein [Deltaproteobacteria bacterium]